MTKKNASDLQSSAATRYPDQTTGAITYDSHLDQHDDEADSYLNHIDLSDTSAEDLLPLVVDNASLLVVVSGGVRQAFSAKVANYTLLDTDYCVSADCTSGNVTIKLPSSHLSGQEFVVIRIDASGNTVTLDGNTNNINGSATQTVASQYDTLVVISDGTDWLIKSTK